MVVVAQVGHAGGMRPHTRLALAATVVLIGVVAVVDVRLLPWAAPVLPLLATALNRIRWTDLARLRVVQGGTLGQTIAVAAVTLNAPTPVAIAGAALVGLAALVTGWGLAKFPIRR